MPVTDQEILKSLRELLKNVDMETTTERKLRQTLEGQFGEDLTSQKHVIGEEVKRYLAEAEATAEAANSADDDEAAAESAEGFDLETGTAAKSRKRTEADAPPKKKRKRSASGGSKLSSEMSAFLGGVERMDRFEVVKQLWIHIKANNLQDPSNKKKIICDEKMLTIFKPPLDQFSMNKQLSRHILPTDPSERKPKKVKESDDGEPKPANGFQKPVRVSPELSSWLGGATEISRPQLTAAFWKYVKENGLQDPANKKNILADAKLKELTGESEFSGFGFMKLFSRHLIKE